MNITEMAIDALVPDPENVRIHPEENLQAIEDSLRQFGQRLPLVVHQETNTVIGGNGTLRAAQRLGMDRVWVAPFAGSMERARALSVALNRTAELAEWDEEGLGDILVALADDGFDLNALGFTDNDLELMFPEEPVEHSDPPESAEETRRIEPEPRDPETPALKYELFFDNDAQQKTFFGFLRWLQKRYPDAATGAVRLTAFIEEVVEGG